MFLATGTAFLDALAGKDGILKAEPDGVVLADDPGIRVAGDWGLESRENVVCLVGVRGLPVTPDDGGIMLGTCCCGLGVLGGVGLLDA